MKAVDAIRMALQSGDRGMRPKSARTRSALPTSRNSPGCPIIVTASEPNGPNGPLIEELQKLEGSKAQYVPRKGEISAWDNADFVKAVEATGRRPW